MASGYRGRFAPSPTGGLHFGSLVAAAGSWIHARRAGGRWLVRIEDIDEPRTVPGADSLILKTLEAYHLNWDEEVVWQSQRHWLYAEAIEKLGDKVFACACSRKETGDRYPGTCRNGVAPGRMASAIRIRVPDDMSFGDFVLRRADGYYAYQLAVVVDDASQGITDVVRGADLLDSTLRQIYLQEQLGVPTPNYLHLPVATNAAGEKLSKQTNAPPIPVLDGALVLYEALVFLGLAPPEALRGAGCAELLQWSLTCRIDRWRTDHSSGRSGPG
jgi:glutamyl-Q tRNA(Asp) synthetase